MRLVPAGDNEWTENGGLTRLTTGLWPHREPTDSHTKDVKSRSVDAGMSSNDTRAIVSDEAENQMVLLQKPDLELAIDTAMFLGG